MNTTFRNLYCDSSYKICSLKDFYTRWKYQKENLEIDTLTFAPYELRGLSNKLIPYYIVKI